MPNTDMAEIISMAKGLQNSADQASDDVSAYLKYTKVGLWLWGAEDTEIEPDSKWLVHPQSFRHGWIAWGDNAHGNSGEKLGDVSVPAVEPLPLESGLDPVQGSWAQQISMHLICLNGFDKDVKVVFNSNSMGGRKLYQKVVNAVIAAITKGEKAVAPVLKLDSDSYKHKKFGQIYTPLMEIVGWKTMEELNAVSGVAGIEAPTKTSTGESQEDAEARESVAKAKAKAKVEAKAKAKAKEEIVEKAKAEAEEAARATDEKEINPEPETQTRQRRQRRQRSS